MEIGQLIKLERQRQNMKQEVLANRICVPSYLSKFENGLVTPSEEIRNQLLLRLNISFDSLNSDLYLDRSTSFKLLFKVVLNSRDKQKAEILQLDIHSYIDEQPLDPYRLTLFLLQTRLMLMLPDYYLEVQTNMTLLEEFRKEMNPEQLFYLYTIQGIIAYQNNQFRQASEIFSQVFSLFKNYRLEDWELAELHYLSSLSLLSESRYILAIDYVKEALSYFNQEILIERSIECLIILGIAQKNTGILKEAVATFEMAKEINSKIDSSKFNGIIEQNIGACYSLLKNQKLALYHFQKSLELKSNPNSKIITILSIMKEYHKNNDADNAKIWLKKGLELLEQLSESNKILFSNHFAIYKAILLDERELISTFNRSLDFFEGKQNFKQCFIYCHVIAKKLADNRQYKQATIYYELGFNYHLKLLKVTNWEELS